MPPKDYMDFLFACFEEVRIITSNPESIYHSSRLCKYKGALKLDDDMEYRYEYVT